MPKGWKPVYSSNNAFKNSFPSDDSDIQKMLKNTPIFISYAREDQKEAIRLYNDLRNAGLQPWLDKKDLLPGQNWEMEIRHAIQNSTYFIPLYSSNSVKKIGYVQNEFNFALEIFEKFKKMASHQIFYIPIRLDECNIPHEKIQDIHRTDLFPSDEDWSDGVKMIVEVIVKSAKNLQVFTEAIKLGDRLNDLKKFEDSIRSFDNALRLAPNNALVLTKKGDSLSELGKYEEAIECYDRALESTYDNQSTYVTLFGKGEILEELGKYEEAIECYDRALVLNSNEDLCWFRKGESLTKLQRYKEAIECYDRASNVNSGWWVTWDSKGNALFALNRYSEAIECYDRALKLDSNLAQTWNSKGAALSWLDKLQEAIESYNRALNINPRLVKAWENKGQALRNLRQYQAANECFDQAKKLDYHDSSLINKLNSEDKTSLNRKVHILYSSKNYKGALDCAEKVLEIDPRDAYAWKAKGAALLDLGLLEESIESTNRAIEINPNDSNNFAAWNNKGAALNRLGRYREALGCLDKALEFNSNFANIWIEKGKALEALGFHKQSQECYDKARSFG